MKPAGDLRLLIDCGQASKLTQGLIKGVLTEADAPPYSWRLVI
jgi:hypothetical protein